MSLTTDCKQCGIAFKRMSLKSMDSVCKDCKGQRNHKQVRKITVATNGELDARLRAVEKSLSAIHTALEVAIEMAVTQRLEAINQTLDDCVQNIEALTQEVEDIHNQQ